LSDDEKRECEILRQRLILKGVWMRLVSHQAVGALCRFSGNLTIAEDDAVFRADFEHEANRVIASLSPDWDMILWGWNFDSILGLEFMANVSPAFMRFDQDQMRQGIDFFVDSVEK
jgi:hypothetical protein